jgi:mRNA interferase MazF
VIAVPVTSQPGSVGFPLTLELTSAKLPKRSWAKISQIRTLSTKRLRKMIEPMLEQNNTVDILAPHRRAEARKRNERIGSAAA